MSQHCDYVYLTRPFFHSQSVLEMSITPSNTYRNFHILRSGPAVADEGGGGAVACDPRLFGADAASLDNHRHRLSLPREGASVHDDLACLKLENHWLP